MKRAVRCFEALVNLPSQESVQVHYVASDFGYSSRLYTCLHCGGVFVFDDEDPRLRTKAIDELVQDKSCRQCGTQLKSCLARYPQSFRGPVGEIGHYHPTPLIPGDEKSVVVEFEELLES
jgi:hypothetical protein